MSTIHLALLRYGLLIASWFDYPWHTDHNRDAQDRHIYCLHFFPCFPSVLATAVPSPDGDAASSGCFAVADMYSSLTIVWPMARDDGRSCPAVCVSSC